MDAFKLTDREYQRLASLVYETSGIHLGAHKKELVRTRFSRLLREKGLRSFGEYYTLVTQDTTGREVGRMVDAISTNVTGFFREPGHFHFIEQVALPTLIAHRMRTGGIRIWSAGCSTGEEPYTLSICLHNCCTEERGGGPGYSILATDLSERVLEVARQGIYSDVALSSVPKELVRRYFQKGTGANSGFVRVKPAVMKPVVFRQLNLMHPFSFDTPFDMIFCRNVLIYFTESDQKRLIRVFSDNLIPGGYLFIGHSESLLKFRSDCEFTYVRPTIYKKA